MTHASRLPATDEATKRAIFSAQAVSVLDGVPLSLSVSGFLACSTGAVLWFEKPDIGILLWLTAILAVNLGRFIGLQTLRRGNMAVDQPQKALDILSYGAFAGGVMWSAVPVLGALIGSSEINPYVIYILCGICAGSLIQSMAYSRTTMFFAIPPIASTLVTQLIIGTPSSLVIAADTMLFAVVMFRASQIGEKSFIRSEDDRLKALAMASSLAKANAEIRQSNRQLLALANRDPLTGLANRNLFHNSLRSLLSESRPSNTLALLTMDLDRFKAINDTLGHYAGDVVLTEIGKRLTGLTGPEDIVARLGGDEFAVIVVGADAEARGRAIGERIVKLAGEPVFIDDRPVTVGASAGLARHPDHGETADALFANADIALYSAKTAGRRQLGLFNPALKVRIERQRLVEETLTEALENDELQVVFQPQVEIATGTVTGFEALLRWTHPDLGAVSPPDIVVAAQALHMSTALTGYVANRAAILLKALPAHGLPDASVAINVSPREFSGDTLSRLFIDIARDHDVDPARMEIEITEEATLDPQAAGAELARLEAAGFRLAVDDFGMGHSSLAYLVSLRINRLKIDRSFVQGIETCRQNQTLVTALVGIGRALSIDIIVEGVENAAEARMLQSLGCRHGQGYLYARPMPAEDIPRWLAEHAARQADWPSPEA